MVSCRVRSASAGSARRTQYAKEREARPFVARIHANRGLECLDALVVLSNRPVNQAADAMRLGWVLRRRTAVDKRARLSQPFLLRRGDGLRQHLSIARRDR
jgi:hypothetical protein